MADEDRCSCGHSCGSHIPAPRFAKAGRRCFGGCNLCPCTKYDCPSYADGVEEEVRKKMAKEHPYYKLPREIRMADLTQYTVSWSTKKLIVYAKNPVDAKAQTMAPLEARVEESFLTKKEIMKMMWALLG